MSSKVITAFALIAFAFGVALTGDVVAGEKSKGRTVNYYTKWEKVDVGDEEGHLVAVYEARGIGITLEGNNPLGDGLPSRGCGIIDINLKTGVGSGSGYEEVTDNEGDKYYSRWEGKRIKGELWASYWEGESIIYKGTGKYEGIKGKITWVSYPVAPMQSYTDWEMEVELPGQ
jgi:hypothetical protein